MTSIRVGTDLPLPPAEVWAALEDIASHVDWMADAESITFTSETRTGVGTTFDCVTRVGPLRVTDRMEVTEWAAAEAMGVRHVGLVTGEGRFTLTDTGPGTRFEWTETLHFPWWLGGPIGEFFGAPVLKWIWRGNLRRLAASLGSG